MLKHIMRKDLKRKLNYLYRGKHLWTAKNIVKSPFQNIAIPDVTIPELIWSNMQKWFDKTAIICGVTDRKYTYLELYRQSQTLAATLRRKFKIKDGDSIAIMLPNIPEYPVVTLGILSAGGIVTTLNPIYSVYEIQRQFALSKVELIITLTEIVPVIKQALVLSKLSIPIIVVDVDKPRPNETVSYKELVNDEVDTSILKEVKRDSEDISLVLYSSGTTGLPKGVNMTHRNIVANCLQQDPANIRIYDLTTESNQDTILALVPMFHSFGMSIIMLHKLSVGLKLVTVPKFEPDTFENVLEKHNLNLLCLAPPTVLFLGSSPRVTTKHFKNLKCMIVGAAPLPKADIENFLNKVDHEIRFNQAYGLTETGPLATMCPIGFKSYTSVGFALPNVELRIIDENRNNLGPNEYGELLIKGPNIMKGYRNNPEANKHAFLEDVWFRTGDLTKINEDGSVTIADRLKELIKVNGFQVAPAELESVIKEHPAVFDVAVIGVPDSKTGEKPKAFVVLKEDVIATEADIKDFVSKRLAPYKHVKEILFLKNIEKNPSGKILRRLLVEKYT